MKDWRSRLRKLVALAEDQAGTPEGDIAARLAREIMSARRKELQGHDLGTRERLDPFTRKAIDLGGSAFWRRRVASLTALHCECLCSFVGPEARLSGRQSTVLVAEYLYRVMSRSIVLEQVAWLGERDLLEDTRAANDFAQSAVLALDSRLRDMREEARHDPQAAALARTDQDALRRWLAQRGVRLRKEAPFPFAYSQEGYEAGYRVPIQRSVAKE
jgi:hypothetical protein